ncbi:MAG: SCO2521 family protein [Actinoplanes sp.]
MLTFGEVHTGLLQNSTPLSADQVAEVLRPLSGEQIRRYERPLSRAVSADRPIGVDCRLPIPQGTHPHVVGTVLWHAAIVGGHLAQSSTHANVVTATEPRRFPWSHYTAFPGRLETLGEAGPDALAQGFLHGPLRPEHLDTAAIATQALDRMQRSALLDRLPALRTRRTRLRWAVVGTGPMSSKIDATFRVVSEELRTMEVAVADEMVPGVITLCEDLALHDWLLTTVSRLLEATQTSRRLSPLEKTRQLRPVMENFLHLWLPGARIDQTLEPVWLALEHRPGFTRQWETLVSRIRDQVSLSTMELLEGASAALPVIEVVGKPRPRLGPRPPRRKGF